uniref:Uncharacterized protein n=1 Tax=Anguilla anguilla TaxID=7936 RepID=A0A0E9VZN6_ANGAN
MNPQCLNTSCLFLHKFVAEKPSVSFIHSSPVECTLRLHVSLGVRQPACYFFFPIIVVLLQLYIYFFLSAWYTCSYLIFNIYVFS